MEKFTVTVHQKQTIWEQTKLEIEAETQEQANQKAIELYDNGELWEAQCESEMLYDTAEGLTPKQNIGMPTIEMYPDTDTHLAPFYRNA